jgi:vacuolar-type H+-ATPase subunit H
VTEVIKTLIFAGVAIVISLVAAFVSWPKAAEQTESRVGTALFEQFTDPLAASSMKIVTFDDETGQLSTFEVRKDAETEEWTIPSRDGYPADGLEQMKNAANAFVALKVLDTQTEKAEDHDDLGVAEPKLEDLQVGDEGVGRLVTLKDADQKTIAELIIGDVPKDDASQRYVRIPGQDPVYVVRFDDSPLTTSFREWIDNDLLQLSSIELSKLEILDYSATLALGGNVSLTRNYTADIGLEGTEWKLTSLQDYDASQPGTAPVAAELTTLAPLNKARLDELKTALDDLKIVDVVRKPDGMSDNLRANQTLVSNKDALTSLAQRGFYPVPSGPNREIEILSANGELDITLNTGVKYVLRFGNIAGVEDSTVSSDAGINRYLLVTTKLDEAQFPAPELQTVPKSVDELKAKMAPKQEPEVKGKIQLNPTVGDATDQTPSAPAQPDESIDTPADKKSEADDGKPGQSVPEDDVTPQPGIKPEPSSNPEAPASETNEDAASENKASGKPEAAASGEPEAEEPTSDTPTGVSESSGGGEASGAGQAQQQAEPENKATPEDASDDQDKTSVTAPTASDDAASKVTTDEPDAKELTEEEWQEMLEAEQEKIIKQNQRLLDERKDLLEDAQRRVRDLNARFADWYYVIPETTYSKLRFKRADLFEKPEGAGAIPPPGIPGLPGGLPQFNFPGAPGN